jgi:hypothetical protein
LDDKPEVTGGLIADWYSNSQAIHLIYLINDEKFRGKGIAKKLINEGVESIKIWIKKEKGIDIKNLFFESNNPLKTKQENDSFDPVKRLEIFSHLGAKLINIPYVQPALDKKKKEVDNLFLLSFPQFNAKGEKIPATEIADFLKDLYISLGETGNNPALKNMIRYLDRIKDKNGDIQMESLMESSSYQFFKSSVTFHYIEINNDQKLKNQDAKSTTKCNHFSSFETDLFYYQSQKEPPFRTVFEDFTQDAVVILPSIYNYVSEGHSHIKITEPKRQALKINLSISHSIVEKSGNKIVHITIAPASGNFFTELDLIKLSTLFGSKQEESSANGQISFKINDSGKEISIIEFLKTRYDNAQKTEFENLNTGIVQIDLNEFVSNEKIDFERFFDVFMKSEKHKLTNEIRDFSKAICGVILGIFDFRRMENDEIFDTILPIVSNSLSFIVMCRGAVLKISIDDDFMDSISQHIIVSPYILIANAVLTHNEYILFDLKQQIDKLLDQKSNSKLHDLERCQMNARNVLNYQYLHDIFQYPSEKQIIEYGNSQRGITNLYSIILKRVEELSELIEIIKAKKSNLSDALINALLGFIAVMQLKGFFDEILNPKYSHHFTYSIAFLVAGTIFWLVWMKKK